MDMEITIAFLAEALGWVLLIIGLRRRHSGAGRWLMVAALALILFAGLYLNLVTSASMFHSPTLTIESV